MFKKIPERADETVHGYCEPPSRKQKRIVVDSRLTGEERLDTILHEMTHGAFDFLDETYVAQFATDAARILTSLGYTDS